VSPRYKRVLHNDDDTIRTSNNFREEIAQVSSNARHDKSVDLTQSNEYDEGHEQLRQKPKKMHSRIPQSKGKHNRSKNTNKTTTSSNELLPEKLYRDRTIDEAQAELVDDYLVPFHRTQTANMYESEEPSVEKDVRRFKNKKEKKQPHEQSRDISPRTVVNRSIKAAKNNKKRHQQELRRTGAVSEPSKSPKMIQRRDNRPSSWTNQVRE